MKHVCHMRFDKVAAVLYQNLEVDVSFLGVEALRCEDSNPVLKHSQHLKTPTSSPLDTR